MWTQIGNTKLGSASSVNDNYIKVVNSSDIIEGNWVVIEPFTFNCEIRKVISINSSILTLSNPLKFIHSQNVDIFFQTSPNWDILLFGAKSGINVTTGNSRAIESAAYDCAFNGGGIVSIPKGTYILDYIWAPGNDACIQLEPTPTTQQYPKIENIKFIGEGIDISILKLKAGDYKKPNGNDADFKIFHCNNTKYIEWHDMTIDGNNVNVTHANKDQSHAISLIKSNNVVIENIQIVRAIADCIFTEKGDNIIISNNELKEAGRNGITVNSYVTAMNVTNNIFTNNRKGDIDMEPSDQSSPSPYEIIIDNNIFERDTHHGISVSLMGDDVISSIDQRFVFTNNIINNASLYVAGCRQVIICNNTISGSDDESAVRFYYNVGKLVFANNIIFNKYFDSSNTSTALFLFAQNQKFIHSIEIVNNVIHNGQCDFNNCCNVNFIGNKVYLNEDAERGVNFALDIPPGFLGIKNYGNISICSNEIVRAEGLTHHNFIPIQFSSRYESYTNPYPPYQTIVQLCSYNEIKIDNNILYATFPELDYGIYFQPVQQVGTLPNHPPYWERLFIGKGNIINSCFHTEQEIDVRRNSYLTGINPTGNSWISEGTPENQISGQQGTTAIDKTREADNQYQLNSIDGNTGWTLKSEMGKQVLVEDEFEVLTYPTPLLGHAPSLINVFSGNTWIQRSGDFNIINITEGIGSRQTSGNAIYTLDLLTDGEIKMFFEILGTGSTNLTDCGIVFRVKNSPPIKYWQFFLQYENNLPLPPTASINLNFVGSSLPVLSLPVTVIAPCVIVLKVILKGNFISVFFNDLLIWTINDGNNASYAQHGIRSNSNTYLISNFKFIK